MNSAPPIPFVARPSPPSPPPPLSHAPALPGSGAESAPGEVAGHVQEHGPLLVLNLDDQFRITGMNATARQVLHHPACGAPFHSVLSGGASHSNPDRFLAAPGVPHRLTVITRSGLPETLTFHFARLSQGGAVALGSPDVAELRRLAVETLRLNREINDLARQLQQANSELRELNRLKTQFLGMAAHDLRRPVGVILAYGGFVLDESGERLGAEQRALLETCLAAAGGMKRQIDDFLDVSLIESGHWRLQRSPTRLHRLLESVLSLVRLPAARKRVALHVIPPGCEPAPALLDADQVEQVLVNLLANAVEYSPEGATVTLRVDAREGAWEFRVVDQGPGISPEDQARLFQPFSCAGTRKTADERRVGLGLAIARMVVLAHQGTLSVESVPGRGSTFLVTLPTQPESDVPPGVIPRPE